MRVLSSSIARAVQGTSKEEADALRGIAGLERLCKAHGSAMYLEGCMRDWGEDVVSVQLSCNAEAGLNTHASFSSSFGMTYYPFPLIVIKMNNSQEI